MIHLNQPVADPRRGCRREDPITSVKALAKVRKTSARTIQEVASLMLDGVPRIDQEIERDCRYLRNYGMSLSSIQHGRLVLQEVKILVSTGRSKKTKDNSESLEWIIDRPVYDYIREHGIAHLNLVPTVDKPSFEDEAEALKYYIAPAVRYFAIAEGEPVPSCVERLLSWIEWDAVRRRLRSEARKGELT